MKHLINKRILAVLKTNPKITEYKVVEVDPSDNWVKLCEAEGFDWCDQDDITLISILNSDTPPDSRGSAGQLEAVKYHLEDMRRLAFLAVEQGTKSLNKL